MGDTNWPVAGREPNASFPRYLHRGTTPFSLWYGGGLNCTGNLTNAPSIDNLRASPIVIGKRVTLDKARSQVTGAGGVGSVYRVGLYRSTREENIYPDALVFDSGEIDGNTVAVNEHDMEDVSLKPGLYWVASLSGVLAPTLRLISPDSILSVLGVSASLGSTPHRSIIKANAYGALPDPFPSGGVPYGTSAGHLWLHFKD